MLTWDVPGDEAELVAKSTSYVNLYHVKSEILKSEVK